MNISTQAVQFAVPGCTSVQAASGLCKVLNMQLDMLQLSKLKLESLSLNSVLGAIKNVASEELGAEVINGISGIITGYVSEFIQQKGSAVLDTLQQTALTTLGFVGLILNGKNELLLAICQTLVDDLNESLTDLDARIEEAIEICDDIDDILIAVNNLGDYYGLIKEKLTDAEGWLARAERYMNYLRSNMSISRREASDKNYAMAQSSLYIAKHHICPEHSDEYEEIGRKAFSIAQEYGFSNFSTVLNKVWREGGHQIIKNAFGNLFQLNNYVSDLYDKIIELMDIVARVNFLKTSIIGMGLGQLLTSDLFSARLGLNKLISKYLEDLINKVHTMREEILTVVSVGALGRSELMSNQIKWCDTLKLIIASLDSCVSKRLLDTGTATGELTTGVSAYNYMVYEHDPDDNVPSLTETDDFSFSSSLADVLALQTGVFALPFSGPEYVSGMRNRLHAIEEELYEVKNKGTLMVRDISGFSGYGNSLIFQLAELLNQIGLDRAADLLLSGNLTEFASLTYLTATYLGATIDCLKKIYSGLETVPERIAVDNMLRELYVENRSTMISGLTLEDAAQQYSNELDLQIGDKESQIGNFC